MKTDGGESLLTQGKIIFLPVPSRFKQEHFHTETEIFYVDPKIPIPLEVPEDFNLDNAEAIEDLSIEMIISAMIRVAAGEANGETSASDIAYYRQFIAAAKPNLLIEFSMAAVAKAKNGDYDAAIEISRLLLGVFPSSPQALLLRSIVLEEKAESLERAGRDDEAVLANKKVSDAYDAALSADEILPDVFFNAGFFYMKQQNYTKACEYFSEYVPLSEDATKKKKAAAIIHDIKSRNLDNAVFREAYELIRTGNENDGMLKLKSFLEKNPAIWNAWFMLGWALRRQKRWKDGSDAFRKALDLGGDNADTRNELAICLMELGDMKQAQKELETALVHETENIKIISNLAMLALKQGDKQKAEAFFRTILEIDPSDPLANEYING
ncbi:MAG: tetratricopeptide repeat protein [Spirochaetaceae bacterium]|jgi:tetratricopeptide (TPR) repeat protein|nr:tetratricopeptide repeat protein [Spirochaetaceae bacterium]